MTTVVLSKTGKFSTFNHPSAAPQPVKAAAAVEAKKPAPAAPTPAVATSAPVNKPASAVLDGSELEQVILSHLASEGQIADTWPFAVSVGVDHQVLVGVIKSLLVDSYVVDEPLTTSFWTLTEEGKEVVQKGSPEIQVLRAIPEGGITIAELNKQLGETAKIGMGVCMKNKWVQKNGESIVSVAKTVTDETSTVLSAIEAGTAKVSEDEYKNLKKRKLVQQVTRKSYKITKGKDFREKRVKKMADLHKSMLGNKNEVSNICVFVFPIITTVITNPF